MVYSSGRFVLCLALCYFVLLFSSEDSDQTVRMADLPNHHSAHTSRKHAYMYIMLTPPPPPPYSKTGIYRGIHYFFLISAQKRRLWVLVRTASGSNEYPQSMF